jgi:MFS family permease
MTAQTERGVSARDDAPAPLRRNRDFRLLWISQALSDFGSSMTTIAFPLVLLRAGYSTSAAGTIGTATLLTAMIVRVPAGYLTDRLDPRRLMVYCDLVRLALLAAVAVLAYADRVPLALVIAAVVGGQVGLELFRPSQNATLRRVVPREQLASAVSLNQARAYAADIVAPTAAGFLMGLALAIPFSVDALTFAVSALCLASLSGRRTVPTAPLASDTAPRADGFVGRLTVGLRYLVRNRVLRVLSVFFALLNFLFQILVYVVLLGIGRRHGGAVEVGTAMSAASIAGLLGAVATPWLRRQLTVKRVVIGGPTLSGLLLVVAWQTENSAAIVAALCALCVMTPPIGAALAVLLASSVPEEIYGRTTTASSFVAELLQPFGPLAAGILLARFTMGTIAAALAVALIATGALALMLPAQPAVAATEDPTPSTRSSQ